MLGAYSKRVVDLESKCLSMQRQLNDLRSKYVNSFLSDEELETGRQSLSSMVLKLMADLQQQTETLDRSASTMTQLHQYIVQIQHDLKNMDGNKDDQEFHHDSPINYHKICQQVDTSPSGEIAMAFTNTAEAGTSASWPILPLTSLQSRFITESQNQSMLGDGSDNPRTRNGISGVDLSHCYSHSGHSTNQNNNDSVLPQTSKYSQRKCKTGFYYLGPKSNYQYQNKNSTMLSSKEEMELWLEHLFKLISCRYSKIENLKLEFNQRTEKQNKLIADGGRKEYKLAVLQQDLRRRTQTLGRLLMEFDQLKHLPPKLRKSSDVVNIALSTKDMDLNDRIQIVAKAVDNDRDNKVQEWPTLKDLMRETHENPTSPSLVSYRSEEDEE